MLNYFINSPLDQFEINIILGFKSSLLNLYLLNINTFTLYALLVVLIIYSINVYLINPLNNNTNSNNILGSRSYLIQESIYDTIINLVKLQIGGKLWGYYFPLVYTFFIFIFVSNLISIIPYSFALSAHVVFVISISIIIWLGVTIIGLYNHGLNFFSLFVPVGTPLLLVPLLVLIELLSYFARAISLGLRLSANVIAGHLLLMILGILLLNFITINLLTFFVSLLPLMGILCIVILEFAISIIQAYVWSILIASYLKDTLYLH